MPSQAGDYSKAIRREGGWRVNGPKHHEELLTAAVADANAAAVKQENDENGKTILHFPDGSILAYKLRRWDAEFCMVLKSADRVAKERQVEPRYHIWAEADDGKSLNIIEVASHATRREKRPAVWKSRSAAMPTVNRLRQDGKRVVVLECWRPLRCAVCDAALDRPCYN